MVTTSPAASPCPIARSLAVLGERWTLLVVREAFSGRTRFADFRAQLGIAPDVLTDRLQTLVEFGILERRAYREERQRERTEYVLTPAGRDLTPVLASLAGWGRDHLPAERFSTSRFVEIATDNPVRLTFVDGQDRPIPAAEVALVQAS
ncbi:MAG TPA: helix-turn-helix domain-containing protein [Propionibacteriaceae bacterium]